MHVQFVKTRVVDANNYVDLLSIDGQLKTMWLTKIDEPNVFQFTKVEEGDTFDTITQ
jgi:hypothetical protein